MRSEPRLTIESDGASDEYRIRGRRVEFRPGTRGGSAHPDTEWRRLAPEDILMHLALQTIVGDWLMLRVHQRVLQEVEYPLNDGRLLKAR